MKKTVILSLCSVATLLAVQSAKADTLADWTFQTSASSNNIVGAGLSPSATQSGVLADIRIGTASASHASSTTGWSMPSGNGSSNSWSSTFWAVGDYYQFSVSTIGYQNIMVTFDQASSSTGPKDFNFQYSTDGSSFTTFTSYVVQSNGIAGQNWTPSTSYPVYNLSFDLSAITSLANDSAIFFRTTMADTTAIRGGTVATAGADRIDNFIINGTPVPEPATLALASLGGLSLILFRRQRE